MDSENHEFQFLIGKVQPEEKTRNQKAKMFQFLIDKVQRVQQKPLVDLRNKEVSIPHR